MTKNIEIINDTDFTNEELEAMEWECGQTQTCNFSTLIILSFYNHIHKIAKDVYVYGDNTTTIEYYEYA
jgi:hypothetical protein